MPSLQILAIALATATSEPTIIKPAPPGTSPTIVRSEIPVIPGAAYAATWSMKVQGEKIWRFRAEFAGVILSFTDSAGKPVSTLRRHTHCYRTEGLERAWYLFEAPRDAAHVSVAFSIVSKEALPGEFHIQDVEVVPIENSQPAKKDAGILSIDVRDSRGEPTPARIYVRDAQGTSHVPPYAFAYDLGGTCFYFQDLAVNWMELPAGVYDVTVMKGFEHTIARRRVHVEPGKTSGATLTLKCANTLNRQGWFSGDHHTHLFRHARSVYPMMDVDDVYTAAKAEGMAYLPFMGEDKVDSRDRLLKEPQFIALMTRELTRDLWGHICPIGLYKWPATSEYGDAWPMNYDLIAQATHMNAAVAYAHPYCPIQEGTEFVAVASLKMGLISREFPIDLALGQSCTVDILTQEYVNSNFQLKLRDYMRLLNLGFRAGVSGSTDFHLDQKSAPIGGLRTYVQAKKLTWPQVAKAYREGRTFATNGPLIQLKVNGKIPGETVKLKKPMDVTSTVDASSLWGINNVAIWFNGSIIDTLNARDGAVHELASFTIPHSGWILAIATGDDDPRVMNTIVGNTFAEGQYAITSPVYIEVKSYPQPPVRESARYYVQWIDAVETAFGLELHLMHEKGESIPPKTHATVIKRLNEARTVFEEKTR
jgi:hypothetical protein